MLGKKYGGDEEIGKAFKLRRREDEHSWILQVKSTAKAIYLDSRGDVLKVAGLFMLGKRCMLATLV